MTAELNANQYFESLQYLEGRKFSPITSAARLFALLGNPQDAVPAVHVAGTNGKGSVSAMIASMLYCAGYHVGQTSSPHLSSVAERCLVDGRPMSEETLNRTVEEVVSVAQRAGIAPSYFVLGVMVAFTEFARRDLDWVVAEVGLGGKLDATNLISAPKATVITGISADHIEILGPELRDIARNKAGIAKPDVPLFVGEVSAEAREEIDRTAAAAGTRAEVFGRDFFFDEGTDELVIGKSRRPAFTRELPLEGEYQVRNAALAARVGYSLGLSEENIREGLIRVRWPGRLEWIFRENGAPVLLDVAHNVEGVEALCRYLLGRNFDSLTIVLSALQRKDWRGMLERFETLHGPKKIRWIFTESGHPGAVRPSELKESFGSGEAISVAEAALERALEEPGENSAVVVTGSVFLVGRLRSKLVTAPFATIA